MTDSPDDLSSLDKLPLETPEDFEKAAQEIERTVRPSARAKMLAAMVRGMAQVGASPLATERAIARFFLETPPEKMEMIKSAGFQLEYFTRLRDWALYGPASEAGAIVEAMFGVRLTARDRRHFGSRKSREGLASAIEAAGKRDGIAIPPRESRDKSRALHPGEFTGLRRAFRVIGPGMLEAIEKAESGDPAGLAQMGLEVSFGAPALLLSSPSPEQRFGRGTRSVLLLPEDRRRCQFKGCNRTVKNRRKYCETHRQLAQLERDRIKKRRRRDHARVLRTARLAERTSRK